MRALQKKKPVSCSEPGPLSHFIDEHEEMLSKDFHNLPQLTMGMPGVCEGWVLALRIFITFCISRNYMSEAVQ